MIRAVYPGTFDPLTRGHEDLVRRASRLFDAVILGVADSRTKRTFFSLQERIDMAREVLAGVKNLKVVGFDNLLIDFVRQQDARVALREAANRASASPAGLARAFVHPVALLEIARVAVGPDEVAQARAAGAD